MVGFGTEKIEEELATLIPDARIARMDQDTTRGKHAFEQLLDRFGAGDIDVLVGTQMVTKGLDFDRATVVGILAADDLLRFPDLRAHERGFQLMAQVAGRPGEERTPGWSSCRRARSIIRSSDTSSRTTWRACTNASSSTGVRMAIRPSHGWCSSRSATVAKAW